MLFYATGKLSRWKAREPRARHQRAGFSPICRPGITYNAFTGRSTLTCPLFLRKPTPDMGNKRKSQHNSGGRIKQIASARKVKRVVNDRSSVKSSEQPVRSSGREENRLGDRRRTRSTLQGQERGEEAEEEEKGRRRRRRRRAGPIAAEISPGTAVISMPVYLCRPL